jgi:crossover junction endodeoxyribonuclease RuvC
MTFRVTLGCDPGNSGAIAVIADGQPTSFIDIPTKPRKTSGFQVDCLDLAARIRGLMQMHPGAHFIAVVEEVNAMPSAGGADGEPRRRMGSSTSFKFGQSYGALQGVLGGLGVEIIDAFPASWKRHYGLKGQKKGGKKDDSRLLALEKFPGLAKSLARKKDSGRADALLIALWAQETEQVAA